MSDHISVTIPVLPHIKKYLDKNTFLKSNYNLTLNDNIGIFIMRLLDPAPKYAKQITQTSVVYIGKKAGRKKAELININLAGYSSMRRTYISSRSIHLFNSWVDDILHREMYIYIEGRLMERGRGVELIIRDFLDKYNFSEDDLTLGSLKKWYFRMKKKHEAVN